MSRFRLNVRFTIASLAAPVAVLVLTFAAQADTKVPGPGTGPGKPISFAELRERCLHPETFDVQRAPQNIRVLCTDSRLVWAASAPGEVNLPCRRKVTSGLFADKFFVNAEQRELPIYAKSGSCHRFKEIEETLTVERPLSCAEILAIKGELTDFCSSVVEAAKGANPKLVEVRETGNVRDTCGAGGVQHLPGKR